MRNETESTEVRMAKDVIAMVRGWIEKDGNPERTALWMRDMLRIGPLGTCRMLVQAALYPQVKP